MARKAFNPRTPPSTGVVPPYHANPKIDSPTTTTAAAAPRPQPRMPVRRPMPPALPPQASPITLAARVRPGDPRTEILRAAALAAIRRRGAF